VLFNFHGYPWLIHRLAYRRRNHENFHVRGYKEHGNINTPLELAINNEIDRFTIAMDVIKRVARLQVAGAHAKEGFRNLQLAAVEYAHTFGTDAPEYANWTWTR
jgi:xylulose-5-phosphate/fructose-6-phosphate phosphoketolase